MSSRNRFDIHTFLVGNHFNKNLVSLTRHPLVLLRPILIEQKTIN